MHWSSRLALLLWAAATMVASVTWLLGRAGFEEFALASRLREWISGGLLVAGILVSLPVALARGREAGMARVSLALNAAGLLAVWLLARST